MDQIAGKEGIDYEHHLFARDLTVRRVFLKLPGFRPRVCGEGSLRHTIGMQELCKSRW